MKIIHVNTMDINGGAARAAYRLHKGLELLGQQSLMLVRDKTSEDATVYSVQRSQESIHENEIYLKAIKNNYINANRTKISNLIFSLPYSGLDLSQTQEVIDCNIIHLHWVSFECQSYLTIQKLLALGKPVVWTLHDMSPFTGGCHSSAGCNKYQQDCIDCPQLIDDPNNLPATILKDKLNLLAGFSNLTIVAPSQQMAKFARSSQLFKHCRIEVIHNSLETNIFKPLPKSQSKLNIGISSDTRTILFGAEDGNQSSKGFAELLKAIQICLEDYRFQELVNQKKIKLLCFGHPSNQINNLGVDVVKFGYVRSNEKLSEIYSASDIFIQPSLEESFGNTTLESMSCGTPVIAFDVGIAPEIIKEDITGRLIPLRDVHQMATAIIDYILDPQKCEQMGYNCRLATEYPYSIGVQANRYLDLYVDLLGDDDKLKTQKFSAKIGDNENPHVFAPLDISLGSEFEKIFYKVLIKAIMPEYLRQKDKSHDFLQLENELRQCRSEIESMKTSKFWKLRTLWFMVKKKLGLPVDDF